MFRKILPGHPPQKWQKARNDKDFALADELRKTITEKGIVL